MSLLPSRHALFDDLFRDFSPGFLIKPLHGDPLPSQIKIDVKEAEDRFLVQAELPGVNKDDIHVDVEGAMVTLRAEVRQQDSQHKDERLLRSERYTGTVARSFQLPAEVDQAEASARFENGLLSLNLPKKKSAAASRKLRID